GGGFGGGGGGEGVENHVGIGVAGEDALEVQHREAAHPPHLDGEGGTDHAVHGRGDDRDREAVAAQLPGDVHLAGVDRQGSGDQRDVVEAVRRPGLSAPPDPHAHTRRLPALPGPAWWACRPPQTLYIENRPLRPTVCGRGQVYGQGRGVSTGGPGVGPLPENPEALQLQVRVDELQALDHLAHLPDESAGADHLDVGLHLEAHALDDPVYQPGPAIDHPGLDVGDRVPPDPVLRPHQLDAEQARGARDQRLARGVEPGRDGAADELAPPVHAVEARGGTEVHDDERGAVEGYAGHTAHHAIGTDFSWEVDGQRHVRGHARLHVERAHPEVALAHPLERLLDRGYHVGDRHAGDVVLRDPPRAE